MTSLHQMAVYYIACADSVARHNLAHTHHWQELSIMHCLHMGHEDIHIAATLAQHICISTGVQQTAQTLLS